MIDLSPVSLDLIPFIPKLSPLTQHHKPRDPQTDGKLSPVTLKLVPFIPNTKPYTRKP